MKWIVRIVVVVAVAFLGLEINRLNDALTSCLSDVQNECGGVIDYAISLEDENAKISRQLKECREK
jgi:hypothetical protein